MPAEPRTKRAAAIASLQATQYMIAAAGVYAAGRQGGVSGTRYPSTPGTFTALYAKKEPPTPPLRPKRGYKPAATARHGPPQNKRITTIASTSATSSQLRILSSSRSETIESWPTSLESRAASPTSSTSSYHTASSDISDAGPSRTNSAVALTTVEARPAVVPRPPVTVPEVTGPLVAAELAPGALDPPVDVGPTAAERPPVAHRPPAPPRPAPRAPVPHAAPPPPRPAGVKANLTPYVLLPRMRRKPQRVIYEDHEFKVLDSTERSLCPLTRAVLVDAVRSLCGHVYSRHAIVAHMKISKKCPVCPGRLAKRGLTADPVAESRSRRLENAWNARIKAQNRPRDVVDLTIGDSTDEASEDEAIGATEDEVIDVTHL